MLEDKKNAIAIWVAQIDNSKVIEDYLREDYAEDDTPISPFAADLKSWYDHDFMETNFLKGKGKTVCDLLEPCSYSASYLEATLAAAKKKKIKSVNAAVLLYDQEYKGKRWPSKSPFKFLGNFSYSTKPVLKTSSLGDIKGHSKTCVGPIGFTHDERHAITCGFDGTVIAWDSRTGKAVIPPTALTDGISSFNVLRLTSDDRCLVSNISNTFVQSAFPDVAKNSWKLNKLGLSDVSQNASFGLAYETVINLKTGKRSKHQPKEAFEVSVFVGDDNLLLWTEQGELCLWNARTGKTKCRTDVRELGKPYTISLSDCGTLAGACIEDSGFIFDLKTGTLVSSFTDKKSKFRQIQFAGPDTFLVIDYNGFVQSRSVKTSRVKKSFGQPRTKYWGGGLSVSGNGKYLSVIETNQRLLDVWRVRDAKHVGRYQARKNKSRHLISKAVFSGDGSTIVVGESEGNVVFVRNGRDGLSWN